MMLFCYGFRNDVVYGIVRRFRLLSEILRGLSFL